MSVGVRSSIIDPVKQFITFKSPMRANPTIVKLLEITLSSDEYFSYVDFISLSKFSLDLTEKKKVR